jgi:UDP-N-acetylmuramate--alanine ligase
VAQPKKTSRKSESPSGPLGSVRRVHFIGIGGSGMSGIAAVLCSMHYQVSGSDLKPSDVTGRLKAMGARIVFGHKAENVRGADVAVFSAAVPQDNPEIREAKALGIPVIPRTEMLAELMRVKYGIAISGTHGKTTTTSMVGMVLQEAKMDPTLVVGGQVDAFQKTGAQLGASKYLVVEACEAFGEFQLLSPIIALVTNIDDDHLDFYGSVEKVREAFVTFTNKVPFYGCAILGIDDPQVRLILPQIKRPVVTYGLSKGAHLTAKKVVYGKEGCSFDLMRKGRRLGRVTLHVPGHHNLLNALAAAAVALELKAPFAAIASGLSNFTGVKRRFERLGSYKEAPVVDDYAHHPTAVRETLGAARRFAGSRKLLVVFQPHLFSRTQLLRDKFGAAFGEADEVVVAAIYPSREKPIPGVTGKTLLEALRENKHPNARYIEDRTELVEYLKTHVDAKTVLLTMGAGDIWKVGADLAQKHKG